MLWNLPCVAPAFSGSVPPSRERMEKWTARAILHMRASTTSCTQALSQTRSSSSKMGLSLLNAQRSVAWLTLGHFFNFSIIYPESTKETFLKTSLYVLLLHPMLIYRFGAYEVFRQLMFEHTEWGEPQLRSSVHKPFSSVPCLSQNAVWRCWHEKWLAWVKIAESSC